MSPLNAYLVWKKSYNSWVKEQLLARRLDATTTTTTEYHTTVSLLKTYLLWKKFYNSWVEQVAKRTNTTKKSVKKSYSAVDSSIITQMMAVSDKTASQVKDIESTSKTLEDTLETTSKKTITVKEITKALSFQNFIFISTFILLFIILLAYYSFILKKRNKAIFTTDEYDSDMLESEIYLETLL